MSLPLYSVSTNTTELVGKQMYEVVITSREAVLLALIKGLKTRDSILKFYKKLVNYGLVILPDTRDVDFFLNTLREFGILKESNGVELDVSKLPEEFVQALMFKKKFVDVVLEDLRNQKLEEAVLRD